MVKGPRALLPPEEEKQLQQIVQNGAETLRQRAQVLLAWNEGRTASEIARRNQISENQVRYLLKLFRQKGLDLFMIDSAAVNETPTRQTPQISVEALCAEHHVDLVHAQQVGRLATTLFDATTTLHRLPDSRKQLLETAAMLHNLAFSEHPEDHEVKGRDMIMAQPIRGISDEDRLILACITAFHRLNVHPEVEPAYLELSESAREETLALSAIFRIADGLDSSQSQTTHIENIQTSADSVTITLSGTFAQQDSAQAYKKADLWTQVFKTRIRLVVPAPAARPSTGPLPKLSPTLNTSMSVVKAARAFASNTLDRVEWLFKNVQTGDPTFLPPMSREANRLIHALTMAELSNSLIKEARWFLDSVEQSHILATLADRLAAYGEDSDDEPTVVGVATQLMGWKEKVDAARQAIKDERYSKFVADIRQALTLEAESSQMIAFHVGSILWEQMAALRDVMETGTTVEAALEATRCLQDHLIGFRDLLGPEVSQVLDMLAPFEGYLSAIQTTQGVAKALEPKPIKKGRKTVTATPEPSLEALGRIQMQALETLADGLPVAWSSVNSPIFRRALSLAVAAP